jgi:murein DD-endopeptidase MepM/ murein hydrolase activator NlpD
MPAPRHLDARGPGNAVRPFLQNLSMTFRLALALVMAVLPVACGKTDVPPVSASASASDVILRTNTTVIRGEVPRNATLDSMLRDHGMAADVVHEVVSAARTVFDPRRLKSLQPYALVRTLDGALKYFDYEIDADSFLRVAPDRHVSGDLRAEVLPIPKTLQHVTASGAIDAETPSLFESIQAAGETPELAIQLARVFGGEIDFNTELQPADRYMVAFERFVREGRPASYGVITAAEFQNDGRVLRAIRFTPPGGEPGYFDEKGRSLRRFFLRSPLKFEPRITSRFSLRRMHPVLHTARAHRGVDYGAPHGADVIAIAAGTVVSTTYDGTNGRMIRLRHASGYESSYLHLSGFAAGIRPGARVTQGQTIGRVGSTGLATGPHLHYALRKNGAFVNPLREHHNMPPGEPVPPSALAAFESTRDAALAQLGISIENAPAAAVASRQ